MGISSADMVGCSVLVNELSSAAANVCIAWPPGMYLGQSGMTWVPQGGEIMKLTLLGFRRRDHRDLRGLLSQVQDAPC